MKARSSRTRSFLWAAVLVGVLAFVINPAPAHATQVTFNLDYVFSGFTPAGPTPWGTAVFDDGGGTGTVTLTLTSNLTSGQFITDWFFNSTTAVTIAFSSQTGTFAAPTANCGNQNCIHPYSSNAYQADGDGLYDFGFQFSSAGADRFDGTDQAVYTITGAGITANTFNVTSSPAGGAGPFHTAAHVQGIPGGCSGWVSDTVSGSSGSGGAPCTTVPEPSTLLLLGSALAGLGLWGRQFTSK